MVPDPTSAVEGVEVPVSPTGEVDVPVLVGGGGGACSNVSTYTMRSASANINPSPLMTRYVMVYVVDVEVSKTGVATCTPFTNVRTPRFTNDWSLDDAMAPRSLYILPTVICAGLLPWIKISIGAGPPMPLSTGGVEVLAVDVAHDKSDLSWEKTAANWSLVTQRSSIQICLA